MIKMMFLDELYSNLSVGINDAADDFDYAYSRLDELRNSVFMKIEKAKFAISNGAILSGYSGNGPWIAIPSGVIIINNDNPSGDGWIHNTKYTDIFIPSSVTSILDPRGTGFGSNIKTITYFGTISEWNAITKTESWKTGLTATKITCSNGEVAI